MSPGRSPARISLARLLLDERAPYAAVRPRLSGSAALPPDDVEEHEHVHVHEYEYEYEHGDVNTRIDSLTV